MLIMQSNLFNRDTSNSVNKPLADKLRPESLDEFIGQEELVGDDGVIRKLIEKDMIPSMIFWGPPGVGKTTLARIIANDTKSKFIQLSAVTSGKKDLQSVIKQAKEISQFNKERKTILFIDEIHRFNKAQQDYLLPFVENGTIILIGATTENPSFEVISPLLSRSRIFTLERHTSQDLKKILNRAVVYLEKKQKINLNFEKGAKKFLIIKSNGDPRTLLNALEISLNILRKA
ncbi:AAA family ATPase [Candidatus Dojkabacteria bacterium]|nr:AAA family ATPase [Candidatus Dojkabacteria bacterium]